MFELEYPAIAIIGSGTISAASIVGFIWKSSWWLASQFKETREAFFRALREIEERFDKRHEDNIFRFAVIETKLNTLLKNGH